MSTSRSNSYPPRWHLGLLHRLWPPLLLRLQAPGFGSFPKSDSVNRIIASSNCGYADSNLVVRPKNLLDRSSGSPISLPPKYQMLRRSLVEKRDRMLHNDI